MVRDQNDIAAADLEWVERAGMTLWVLHSCHSTWFLDQTRQRFQRVPRGIDVQPQAPWTPYHRLVVDPAGSFLLSLDDRDTRMLRAWFHRDPCPHCEAGSRTEELRLDRARR